jgi:hypothetical protein
VNGLRVREVTHEHLDLAGHRWRKPIQVAVVVPRVVTNEPANLGATDDECLDHVTADEPARTGYQHFP